MLVFGEPQKKKHPNEQRSISAFESCHKLQKKSLFVKVFMGKRQNRIVLNFKISLCCIRRLNLVLMNTVPLI